MQLSPAYQKWREDTLQEGRQEERRQIVENLLKARFGSVDEPLSRAIAPMLELPLEELARVLLQSSCEELLARLYGVASAIIGVRTDFLQPAEYPIHVLMGGDE